MKSNNAIYSFFIVLALLFWNPLSFHLLYDESEVHLLPLIQAMYWAAFLTGILFVGLIACDVIGETTKNVILSMSSIGILFAVLFVSDGIVGLLSVNERQDGQQSAGIIFEPGSSARYTTTEYDFVVDANNLGLRDYDIDLDKGDKFRILAFGDSWTMGWGVALEDSWPKKLQEYLHANGFENVEVINCGQAGAYTVNYRDYMAKAVPLLRPDLVLVGTLQLDDLAQLYEEGFDFAVADDATVATSRMDVTSAAKEYLKFSFKNILALRPTIDIASNWQQWASITIAELTRLQRLRYLTLDATVQEMYATGNLNPGLLQEFLKLPDRVIVFNNASNSATAYAIREMHDHFSAMRSIANANGTILAFVNLPVHHFTGHTVVSSPSDVLNAYFVENNGIDTIYRAIADTHNLAYIELTGRFRELEDKSAYFFRYDGHPNRAGYAEIANYVGAQLIEQNLLPP